MNTVLRYSLSQLFLPLLSLSLFHCILCHSCCRQFATKCGNFKASHSHADRRTPRLPHPQGGMSCPVRPTMTNIDIDSAIDYRSHLTKKRLIYKHINNMRCVVGATRKEKQKVSAKATDRACPTVRYPSFSFGKILRKCHKYNTIRSILVSCERGKLKLNSIYVYNVYL